MNLIQGKSNQFLREAILEGSLDKARRYLTLKIGKADVGALTESGGFNMLHVAAITGNTQIVVMLLQYGADVHALTDDGYTALDLAIWRGHLQIIELLRSQGSIAPMKEPESLNGRVIEHLGRRATIVDFEPSTSMRSHSLRALYYEDKGEAKLVNLWAGTDYKIVGSNPYYEDLKKHEFTYAEIPYVNETEKYEELLHGEAFFDDDMDDSDSENEVDEVVEVSVPPGPLGVLLDSGVQECALVHGFTNLPTGGKGPIELDGRVVPGMYIIGIDDTNASLMSLQQVTQLLGKLARKAKVIRFATLGHHEKPPRVEFDDDDTDGSSSERSHASAPAPTPPKPAVPSPATTPSASAKPPAAPSGTGIFSSRLSSIAAAMMDKKNKPAPPTTPGASTSSSLPGTPKEAECVHCGMPSTAHKSADCPYR